MKHTILIFALLVLFNSSFACSCIEGKSFCDTHAKYDLTASCVVVGSFPNGISLKVLHILHGSENNDTIKVWDLGGPYNMCNDSLADATAAFLGNIGDTLIIALPEIDTLKNVWDVIGDYRTPGFQCDAYKLTVLNNTVSGFISGSPFCYNLNNCLTSYNYDDYLIDFPVKSLNCQTWLNTDEPAAAELFNYYPNPATDKIVFTTTERGTLTIVNNLGQFVDLVSIYDNETQILTGKLSPGIYFLTFQTGKYLVKRKLIVQKLF